jgi:hypothetical protein
MRYILRALLPGVLGFAVAVLVAACGGSSSLFSAAQATSLNGQLAAVQNDLNNGNCSAVVTDAQSFDQAVSNLSGVNGRLVNNLKQASSALANRAGKDCKPQQTTSVPTTPTKPKTVPAAGPTGPTGTPTTTKTSTTSTSPTTTTGSTSTSPATTGTGPGTTTSGGAGLTGSSTGTGTGGSGGASAGGGNGNGNGG